MEVIIQRRGDLGLPTLKREQIDLLCKVGQIDRFHERVASGPKDPRLQLSRQRRKFYICVLNGDFERAERTRVYILATLQVWLDDCLFQETTTPPVSYGTLATSGGDEILDRLAPDNSTEVARQLGEQIKRDAADFAAALADARRSQGIRAR